MNRATEQEAYELLRKLGISFQKVDHPAITSVKNIPFSLPGPQVKNLLLKSRKGKKIYLVILPDEKHADLKQLAEQLKEKRLSFVSEEQLPDLLGILAGTVTPLALMHDTEKKIQVVIDSAIDRQDTVGFHPNINTTTLIMDFSDFEKILVYLEHLPVYENL
ncbi:prolyl-tRNA synthetase associated domain-containing protein [Enterococcus faecium]|uniref:prolyl-tRNA synthetase associated domain-containing protein n=1 Tax=Enterococcus faecium TaxID=1352 RepID=UPI0020909AF6|nr:YbaK/EbsC family protein [Enterococcus faecium]MCO5425880.1 prolyl-tRNA synthetase associated domain-containing protein [Enterococcus faecium]MCO5520078.1 prolyl-tRNA synthetase associated domain-containing protein [Enterococcus faecium]